MLHLIAHFNAFYFSLVFVVFCFSHCSVMRYGTEPVHKWDRSSLRILGSVGEPINPESWEWLHREVGDRRAPIMDTYWQVSCQHARTVIRPHGGRCLTTPSLCL